MNSQLQLGLVIEGNSTRSDVLRMASLVGELGPVKSSSLRVARRHSNLIRAGYPVANYEDLEPAGVILLKVADLSVPRVAEDIAKSKLPLSGLCFVLCESWLAADAMKPLLSEGASVATALKFPSVTAPWFVVEGQARAVRQMRRLFSRNGIRSVEVNPESKHLLFAAQLFAITLPLSHLNSARDLMRDGGMSGKILWSLLDQMAKKMVLDFSKSPRLEVSGPLGECPVETGETHLEHLDRVAPSIANELRHHLRSIPLFAPRNGDER